MTRGLQQALGLPNLEDLLKEEDLAANTPPDAHDTNSEYLASLTGMSQTLAVIEGGDHGEAMDVIYDETLRHARDISDLAFNVDIPRQARMFEVANQYFKTAADVKVSKRDNQLKTMKLALEMQKFEFLKQQHAGTAPGPSIDVPGTVYASRNEILAQLNKKPDEDDL